MSHRTVSTAHEDTTMGLAQLRSEAVSAANELAAAVRMLVEDRHWDEAIQAPVDLERQSNLTHRLAWQLFKVSMAEEPITEAAHLPRKEALEKFCRAATAQGVAQRRITRARNALRAFEEMVKRIAGTRDTFVEMAASWCGLKNSSAMSGHLRQAYRSSRHIWGLSAKASFATLITLPDNMAVTLRGLCSLQSSRRNTWDVSGYRYTEGEEDLGPLSFAADDGTTLLPKFCKGSLPKLSTWQHGLWRMTQAELEATGETRVGTLVFGRQWRKPKEIDYRFAVSVTFPAECAQVDLVVHNSIRASTPIQRVQASHHSGAQRFSGITSEFTELEDIRGESGFREMSSYPALLEETVNSLGYPIEEFGMYRTRCLYPPTGITLSTELEA